MKLTICYYTPTPGPLAAALRFLGRPFRVRWGWTCHIVNDLTTFYLDYFGKLADGR